MIVATKDLAAKLLEVSGIAQVVSIDDWDVKEFSLEETVASIDLINDSTLRTVLSLEPLNLDFTESDVAKAQVRNRWPQLTLDQKKAVWTSLVTARGESDEASRALENDLRTGTALPELFDGSTLKMLTLSEWENQKANIVKDDMPCALSCWLMKTFKRKVANVMGDCRLLAIY